MHIADINLPKFYAGAFLNADAAGQFIERVENLQGPHPAKLALHQAARMLWLADQIDEVARGRPALQILFYLIAAESLAKMAFRFADEGQSRVHVHRFFGEICDDKHRRKLGDAFSSEHGTLTWEQAVDVLYDVRCDVVHEARYFEFHLADEGSSYPMMTQWEDGEGFAHISISELRQVIIEGAVRAVQILHSPSG